MAEILVFTQPNRNHDIGDVVAIRSDGHRWSDYEKSCEYWTIIRLPRVDEKQLTNLTASRFIDVPMARHSHLLLDQLPINPTLQQVMDATVVKPVAALGLDQGVIG